MHTAMRYFNELEELKMVVLTNSTMYAMVLSCISHFAEVAYTYEYNNYLYILVVMIDVTQLDVLLSFT